MWWGKWDSRLRRWWVDAEGRVALVGSEGIVGVGALFRRGRCTFVGVESEAGLSAAGVRAMAEITFLHEDGADMIIKINLFRDGHLLIAAGGEDGDGQDLSLRPI